ncbi:MULTISPECIES: hypothetical protein [Afipia]|jgi:hypothetical protein|uniref:Uncharacterized protein n=3 Tax=Afipia TaxID=1033 RepID=K8PIQ2_9BRAD|nr:MULTISPECIES: hypothetical protein [Afipia]MAH67615.1 hypothetical protein [Afipia sp.]NGX96147.1 hypothetical protein [Candidatus Afipia apatlaquensis]OUX63261.1 MAG: hypothetical protein CBB64_00020 [Afipia sp. TMED4]EKS41406.1 hypothetical protein HMPREF9695_00498 [Afipia broomeae ATCC 49717]MBB5053582.1 hypothetical protein [Afipia massiliensis]|tara:strand:+ start:1394 stop:1816 length:423 start_codon:yes stop_codon:yes gene_type:complete
MEAALSIARTVEPDLVSLGWFSILWLACCLSGLTISGMLPLGVRANNLSTPSGTGLVVVNIFLLFLLLAGTALFAALTLRVSSIILMASWIFLFVPAILDVFPERWIDSRGGLTVLLCVQAVALVMLCRSSSVVATLSMI